MPGLPHRGHVCLWAVLICLGCVAARGLWQGLPRRFLLSEIMHRLPIYSTMEAAALRVALGCELEPKTYLDTETDGLSATWFVTGPVDRAAKLLEARRLGNLDSREPLAAALAGIRTAGALMQWLAGRARPAFILEGRNGVLSTGALVAHVPGALPERVVELELRSAVVCEQIETAGMRATFTQGRAFPVLPHHVAAAAVVCGFFPLALQGTGERPVLRLTAVSVTEPGLSWETLAAVAAGRPVEPGLDGEHPFHYALEAVRTYVGLRYAEEVSAKNPVHCYRGEGGNPRSALISQALLEEGHPLDLGSKLDRHMAGVD